MALALKSPAPARGARWIGDAWRLFMRRPLAFSALFAVFLLGAMVLSLLPFVGAVLQMMVLPLLSLGYMVASQAALLDDPVHPRAFIEPLKGDPAKRRALVILCAIYALGALLVLVLADAASDGAWRRLQEAMAEGPAGQAKVAAILQEDGLFNGAITLTLLGAALSIPFWHAPALVHWGSQGVAQSLFSSTLAVWRAKGAFLVYGLGWFGLVLLLGAGSALVLGLVGLHQYAGILVMPAALVFSAVFYVSLLFTFNDSFGNAEAVRQAADEPPPTTDMPL